jgi:hypothetical protein
MMFLRPQRNQRCKHALIPLQTPHGHAPHTLNGVVFTNEANGNLTTKRQDTEPPADDCKRTGRPAMQNS